MTVVRSKHGLACNPGRFDNTLLEGGNALLHVDIHLPEPELEAIVKARCAKFGTVKFIRLLPVAKDNRHRFAFVQMATLVENMDLAMAAGGSTLGSGVVALCLETHQ
jgi:hypothetical protein